MSPNSSQEKQTIRLNSAMYFSETCECLLLEVSFFSLAAKVWVWDGFGIFANFRTRPDFRAGTGTSQFFWQE